MKHLPIHTDPRSNKPCLFFHILSHSICHLEAEHGNHAIRAGDAYERAVIFLRLLAGESEWSDGYERKIDDCFEMSDGDAVCGWLLEFMDADPRIKQLVTTHSVCRSSISNWEKYRGQHRVSPGEPALA